MTARERSEGNQAMRKMNLAATGVAAGVTMLLAGCGNAVHADAPPAIITKIAGSAIQQIKLTDQAIHRLGISTQPVRAATGTAAGHPAASKVIPYAAVVYDNDGATWTYVNIAARTYVREPITVLVVQGDSAMLASGPAVGAAVVTVGAAELLGTEYNISGEE
jgi:hypothetical protein